jgi:hypothetical protein
MAPILCSSIWRRAMRQRRMPLRTYCAARRLSAHRAEWRHWQYSGLVAARAVPLSEVQAPSTEADVD